MSTLLQQCGRYYSQSENEVSWEPGGENVLLWLGKRASWRGRHERGCKSRWTRRCLPGDTGGADTAIFWGSLLGHGCFSLSSLLSSCLLGPLASAAPRCGWLLNPRLLGASEPRQLLPTPHRVGTQGTWNSASPTQNHLNPRLKFPLEILFSPNGSISKT